MKTQSHNHRNLFVRQNDITEPDLQILCDRYALALENALNKNPNVRYVYCETILNGESAAMHGAPSLTGDINTDICIGVICNQANIVVNTHEDLEYAKEIVELACRLN